MFKNAISLVVLVSLIAIVGCSSAGKASIYDEPIIGTEQIGEEVQ